MRFNISFERALIKGYPVENGEPARLWLNGNEILPSVIKDNFSDYYYSGFTWGYEGYGCYTTALAVSYALFGDKHIAEALSGLINEQFVQDWPFDIAFQSEINLVDFWSTNKDLIQNAEEQANRARFSDEAQKQLELQLSMSNSLNTVKSLKAEVAPARNAYGPSADTHWLNFRVLMGATIMTRCRIDTYKSSQLLIVTDIQEGSVQNNIEVIIKKISQKLKFNPVTLNIF